MSKFMWIKRCARLLNRYMAMELPLAVGMANALWSAYSPSAPKLVVDYLIEEATKTDKQGEMA